MKSATESEQEVPGTPAEAMPELHRWRAVGWIFRDGGCIAIERQGMEFRSQVSAD